MFIVNTSSLTVKYHYTFVDEAHRAGESYNDFSRYNSLQSIVAHLNRIMRTKGDTEFKFNTDIE